MGVIEPGKKNSKLKIEETQTFKKMMMRHESCRHNVSQYQQGNLLETVKENNDKRQNQILYCKYTAQKTFKDSFLMDIFALIKFIISCYCY